VPSIEDLAHRARWTLVKPEKTVGQFVRGNAIPDYFVAHPEVGSPLGPEVTIEGGGVVQAFTGCVLRWTPANGVEVVTE